MQWHHVQASPGSAWAQQHHHAARSPHQRDQQQQHTPIGSPGAPHHPHHHQQHQPNEAINHVMFELQRVSRLLNDRLMRLEGWQAVTDAGAEGVSQVLLHIQQQLDSMMGRLSAVERDAYAKAEQHGTPVRGTAVPPASGNASTLVFEEDTPDPGAAAAAADDDARGGFSTPKHLPHRKGPKTQLTPPPFTAAAAGACSPFTPLSHCSALSQRSAGDAGADGADADGGGGGDADGKQPRSPVRWRPPPATAEQQETPPPCSSRARRAKAARGGARWGERRRMWTARRISCRCTI